MTSGRPQQRLERTGADDVAAQRLVDREHRGVADRAPGLAQRLRDPVRRQLAGARARAGRGPPRGRRTAGAEPGGVTRPPSWIRASCVEHLRGGPAEGAAPRPHRPEAQVDRLRQPALVDHPATAPGRPVARPIGAASMPAAAHHQPQRRRVGMPAADPAAAATPRTRRHARRRRSRSHRAATSSTTASRRRGRSTTTRSWPRCAAESTSRTANACRLPAPRRRARSARQPVAPRQRLPQRPGARAGRWSGRARPSGPRRASSRPSTRSTPGPSGSASTTSARPAAPPTCPSAQAKVVAPGAAARRRSRRRPARAVARRRRGRSAPRAATAPSAAAAATLSAPTRQRERGTARRAPGPTRPRAPRTAAPARSGPAPRPRRPRPGPAGPPTSRRSAAPASGATSGVTPAAAASRSSSSSRDWSRVTKSGAVMPTMVARESPHGVHRRRPPCGQRRGRRARCGRQPGRGRPTYDGAHGAPPHRGLLRPRQDDHRQVEHAGVQQAVLGRRPDHPARRAALGVRAVRLPRRRRRPRPDGEDAAFLSQLCAGWDVATVREIVAETLHNIVDPIVYDEAVALIEDHQPPAATSSSCPPPAPRWSSRSARCSAPTTSSPPGWRSTTAGTPARSSTTPTPRTRRARSASWPSERGYDLAAQLRLQRLGHRPADAGGRRPRRTRSTPTRSCAGRRRARLAGAGLHPAGRAARPGAVPAGRSRPWPRWPSAVSWPPAAVLLGQTPQTAPARRLSLATRTPMHRGPMSTLEDRCRRPAYTRDHNSDHT